MLEGVGFHGHMDRVEGMLKEIKGTDDRISALFLAQKVEEAGAQDISSKVTNFAEELKQEVDYLQGIYESRDVSSVDLDRLSKMKALLSTAIGSLEAQKGHFGDDLSGSYQKLKTTLQQANFLAEVIPTLKESVDTTKSKRSAHHTRRRARLARRRAGQGRQLALEDISDVINFVNTNKETVFADAKAGMIYHRQNINAKEPDDKTEFRHSFQVLNVETASSPDEMVIVVHQKPEKKVLTRKKKETNVMHIGIGGEKKVKRSVMVDLSSERTAYVAVATSRQDVYRGKALVDKERKTLEALAGKPGIIEIRGHAFYQVKKKGEVPEPLPEKMNMVLALADSDLRGVLRRGRMGEIQRQNYALEMLTGLVEVHKAGLIHFDIKIDNVFVVNGHPKIGDFGSSEKVGTPVTRRGTRSIVPPEMHRLVEASRHKDDLVEEQGNISPRLDVFEMGVILYHMKHGHAPGFSSKIHVLGRKAEQEKRAENFESYAQEIEKWHEEESPVDEEDKIIVSMLHPEPKSRPSAQEVLDQLKRLYSGL